MIDTSKQWQFYNPVKVFVGRGSRARIVERLKNQRILIVTSVRGREQFLNDSVLGAVLKNNMIVWVDSIKEAPGLTDLQAEINQLKSIKVDLIIAFGGGSAIDGAKAIRMGIAANSTFTLLELVKNTALHESLKQVPLYAITTTSGTGSEVTPFATIWHHEIQIKRSLVSESVFATVAVVDAELIDSVPLTTTLFTGLDAINQAAESIWNKNANRITMSFAMHSLKLGLSALPLLVSGEGGQEERDQMAEAGLLAGLAISHTKTALCHSISYPLTAHYAVPHGLACAFTMPAVYELNLFSDDGRFGEVALALTGRQDAKLLSKVFMELNEKLEVKKIFRTYIKNWDQLMELKNEMYAPTRVGNNLAALKEGDLDRLLKSSWY